MGRRQIAAALVLAACAGLLATEVTVVTQRIEMDQLYELIVNSTTEYILQVVPSAAQAAWPARVQARVDGGGSTARPLLLTARQRSGAITWQLPYHSGPHVLRELNRTLCPAGRAAAADPDHCDAGQDADGAGEFSLHVGTACAGDVRVQLSARADADWQLPFDRPVTLTAVQGGPAVRHYAFAEGQDSVRLEMQSEDDVCATLAVQNYTCPIAETLEDIATSALRMTVQRSGGVQLSRERYPHGFYVIGVVHDDDAACGAPAAQPAVVDDLLRDEPAPAHSDPPPAQRAKELTLVVKAALTRGQYALGAGAALGVFLLFYVALGLAVLAQRAPACARFVRPRAVLAPRPDENGQVEVERTMSTTPGQRRRGSTATFDSSDNSDSESDDEPRAPANELTTATVSCGRSGAAGAAGTEGAAPAAVGPLVNVGGDASNGIYTVEQDTEQAGPRPFGLPARLHVAALARRRARVVTARSDRYLFTLYTVALFYGLPVIQFVAAFQLFLNVSGSLDTCYYNFLCAHPAGALSDFNHVLSNAGYLLLGALFLLQVRRRRARRRRKPRHQEYGIPAHYGLLSALGAGMMVVALLSATYHVCPNRLNFQFDVAFMYVLCVVSMVKIYQARHADVNARAHATFGVLAVLIALVVWGVLWGGPLFWSVFTLLHVFSVLLLSLSIYYVGQFRFEKESLAQAARGLRSRPLYTARLVMLLIVNACNWAFALYGLFAQSADFASHLLNVLLFNTLLHMAFYITMKLLHGERLRWYSWAFLGAAAASWAPAMYFFLSGSTDWSASAALSRHRNHHCQVLQFYDSHDLWHMLSAAALYASFNVLLTWDDGLSAVRRTEIAVF